MLILALIVIAVIICIFGNNKQSNDTSSAEKDGGTADQPEKYQGCTVLKITPIGGGASHLNTLYDKNAKWYAKDGQVYCESASLEETHILGSYYDAEALKKLNLEPKHFVGQYKADELHDINYFISNMGCNKYLVMDSKDASGDALGWVSNDGDGILGWHNFEGDNTANMGAIISSYYNHDDAIFAKWNGNVYEAGAAFICMMNFYSKSGNQNSWKWNA